MVVWWSELRECMLPCLCKRACEMESVHVVSGGACGCMLHAARICMLRHVHRHKARSGTRLAVVDRQRQLPAHTRTRTPACRPSHWLRVLWCGVVCAPLPNPCRRPPAAAAAVAPAPTAAAAAASPAPSAAVAAASDATGRRRRS